MDKAQLTAYWQELPWNNIKLKAIEVLPKFVFVVFLILIIQIFAEITWRYFSPVDEVVTNNTQKQTINVKPSSFDASLKKVASYHLFGDANKQAVTQQKVIDAPETRLRLDLKGVFASTNANKALAIISSSKNKDKTYHIGDKVTGGVTLHAVYADRVILKRNGQLETLRLPKSKVDSKAFYTVEQNKAKSVTPLVNRHQTQGSSQRLRKLRDTLVKDPAKVWQQVRINPVMKKGQVKGYTLMHNDKSIMKALNIRKTDIITGINGESLSNPAVLLGLMDNLSNQDSLQLTIERNGQQQTIQLNL